MRSGGAGRVDAAMPFEKVTILGGGLLGGSLALSMDARRTRLWARRAETVRRARDLGIPGATGDLAEAVDGCDLLVLATPIGAMADLLARAVAAGLPETAVVTDVGSVKRAPEEWLAPVLGGRVFVGSHPMAGSERTGLGAARADLFGGAACIVTGEAPEARDVADFWREVGCRVIRMDAGVHDSAVARVSHLPHALAAIGARVGLADPFLGYLAGGGLIDTTRVSSGDPAMWAEIFLRNGDALAGPLGEAADALRDLLGMLEGGDEEALCRWLADAKARRDALDAGRDGETTKTRKGVSVMHVKKAGEIEAELRMPGDKSISHRSVLLAAVSDGECRISNFLPSQDCLHTMEAVRALGAEVEVLDEAEGLGPVSLKITGRGGELRAPSGAADCGNSGTGMRLLAGLLAGQSFTSELRGDESLSSRPMGRIIRPLTQMGARIEALGKREGCAPLRIRGGGLHGIRYEMPVASAQVKSAILLAGLFAEGRTEVRQPAACRDHTERMLEAFGVPVRTGADGWIGVDGGGVPKARDFTVPGDISSAAFWMVAGAARPGNRVVIRDVGLNPTRNAILAVLERMGAGVTATVESGADGEPMGTVEIRGAELGDCVIFPEEVPNLIDEFPVLAVAGALGCGTLTVRNARELRVKESDRIATMVRNLAAFGADVTEFADGFEVRGGRPLHGARVESFGDHRVAMACAILGLFADGETEILDTDCIATSYPGFAEHLAVVGENQETRIKRQD